MADPGFPVGGGVDLVRGAVDPRGGYVSKILHVKTKESGPVGGGARAGRAPPLDPPMLHMYASAWMMHNCVIYSSRYHNFVSTHTQNACKVLKWGRFRYPAYGQM